MNRFRILSIDGGGIKGVFPASFLAAVEDQLPNPIHKYFDLIAGTSTGAIIALGLGLGHPAKRLVQLYAERGPIIFPAAKRTRSARFRNLLFSSRYSADPLRLALTEVFGQAKLGDSQVRLVIPTLNAASGKIHVYKTPHQHRLEMDWKINAVDVALATSAAPTYLPAHVSPQGIPFLDGGLWANNPTGMAVVEAITMLSQERSNIEVLSLGCTKEPKHFTKLGGSKLKWASNAIEASISGQAFHSMGTAALIVGHDHIMEINPSVAPGRFSLDNTRGTEDLRAFGYEEARIAIPELRKRFFTEMAAPYTPLYPSVSSVSPTNA